MRAALVAILLLAGAKEPDVAAPPFFKPMPKPRRGEWLYDHPEPGQTFAEYKRASPVRGTQKRRIVYVQPFLTRPAQDDKLLERIEALLAAWFGRPVQVLDARPVPAPIYDLKTRQFHVIRLMAHLSARLPGDALLLLAVTDRDLALKGFRHALGWGSMDRRVAVFSTHRLGRAAPARRRALGLAIHEATHCLSLPHCTFFRCLMNGAASPAEADTRPMQLCPVCRAKLCWNLGLDGARRDDALVPVLRAAGLAADADRTRSAAVAMRNLENGK